MKSILKQRVYIEYIILKLDSKVPAPFLKMKPNNTVKTLFEKDLTLKRKKSQVLSKIKQLDLTKKILEDEETERCLTQELIERENQIKLEKNAKGIMEEAYSNPLRDTLSNQKTLKPLEKKKQRTAADYWSSDDDSDSDSYEGRTIPIKPAPGKPIFGSTKILKGTEEKKLPLVSVGSQYLSADGVEMHVVLGSSKEKVDEKTIIFPVSKRLLKPLERKEHTACISNRGDRDISQLKLKQHPDPEFTVPKADHRSEHVYGTISWPLPEPIKWTKPQPVKTKRIIYCEYI